jgi:lipopolysaccharide transport system ATP-binding protein
MDTPKTMSDCADATVEFAVRLKGVSKKYHLYDSATARLREAFDPFRRKYHHDFWALRDITLDVPRGSTLGILGVNGSGKSTLLQVICAILQPSTGSVHVNGRIAALIELGAGFNPELSGRENARLNCVILGLSNSQADSVLPLIQSFSDIGEFFDQPVRTYSSGMLMRVAFATAINVDPDILVIDEALAVGDARFQRKCFQRFEEFQASGKTILLVTHDRSAVPRLCTRGLLLDGGQLLYEGDPKLTAEKYGQLLMGTPASRLEAKPGETSGSAAQELRLDYGMARNRSAERNRECPIEVERFLTDAGSDDRCHLRRAYNPSEFRSGRGGAAIVDFLLVQGERIDEPELHSGDVVKIYMRIAYSEDVAQPIVGLILKGKDGLEVFGTTTEWQGIALASGEAGGRKIYCIELALNVPSGDWFIDVAVAASPTYVLDNRGSMIHVRIETGTRTVGVAMLPARIWQHF